MYIFFDLSFFLEQPSACTDELFFLFGAILLLVSYLDKGGEWHYIYSGCKIFVKSKIQIH